MKYFLIVRCLIFFITTFIVVFAYVMIRDKNAYTTLVKEIEINQLDIDKSKIDSHGDNSNNSDNVLIKSDKEGNSKYLTKEKENPKNNLKYILQWTPRNEVPFVYMGEGQEVQIKNKCKYTNCFVTSDASYLGDITKFDAVAFNGPTVRNMGKQRLPQRRSPHQKYVFATIESSHYYPVCDSIFDGYFNWTWTFRLDSESKWGYLVVRDKDNKIIGPKKDMHWIKKEEMKPVPNDLLSVLKHKSKAAAWFVSNCYSRSKREAFTKELQTELHKYDLKVDIYGNCGMLKCDRKQSEFCDELIEKDYFFYLAFENSFSEDYVTEKILHGLQHSAIPIVYGGANYSRFVPNGSYINARELGAQKLAAIMNDLIHNMEAYSSYFKWRSHYSFHRRMASPETDDYCGYCALLNNDQKVQKSSVYQNFRKWWNPADYSCPQFKYHKR